MDNIPRLPALWARNVSVRADYDAWRAEVHAAGKPAAEIRKEWFSLVRPRLKAEYQAGHAFPADEEGNPLSAVRDVFDAAPVPEHKRRMLTLEVRVYGGDSAPYTKLLRDPTLFNALHYHVPPDLLTAGAGDGFHVEEPAYQTFLNLLLAEATNGNAAADKVLAVVGNTSDFGASGIKRITLHVKGSSPRDPSTPAVPLSQTYVGLSTADRMLSCDWLTADIELGPDGTLKFVPAEPLAAAVADYFASLPDRWEVKDSCGYDAIIEAFKSTWDAHYKKASSKLDHMLIRRELGKGKADGWKVKVEDLDKFFSNPERKLSCVVLDLWGNVIWKRVWEERNRNISPDTLYLVVHNEHVWRVNTEARSLALTGIKNEEPAEGAPAPPAPSSHYRVLPELDQGLLNFVLCDTPAAVDTAMAGIKARFAQWKAEQEEKKTAGKEEGEEASASHKKERPPYLNIHYSGNMEALFLRFYQHKNLEPEVRIHDNVIKELRLNLKGARVRIVYFSVEGEPSLVRARSAAAPAPAAGGAAALPGPEPAPGVTAEQHANFLPVFASAKVSLLHRDYLSHYPGGLQAAFQVYGRGALIRNLVDAGVNPDGTNGSIQGTGVDIVSAYASILNSLSHLPVFSSMDDFRPYHGEQLGDYCFYIVENVLCDGDARTWIVLNRKFNLVSGYTLRHCGLPRHCYRIHAVAAPVHLADNPFPDVAERVAGELGDISSLTKFVFNSLIGLTGKRKAENTAGKFTTSYEEARCWAKDPLDVFVFANGFIPILRSPEVTLEDGFYPIQFLVYDRMRVKLLELYDALVARGVEVLGVKTDCFIVRDLPADFPLVSTRTLESMGKWRVEPVPKFADCKPFHVHDNILDVPVPVNLAACTTPQDCEFAERKFAQFLPPPDWATEFNVLPEHHPPVFIYPPFNYLECTATKEFGGKEVALVEDGTLVLGVCAGSGKTTACCANCTGKTLIVVPTNKRVDEFETEWDLTLTSSRTGVTCDCKDCKGERVHPSKFSEEVTEVMVMTTAEFLGKRFREGADGGKEEQQRKEDKRPDLSVFTTIFVDEFFQGSIGDIIGIVQRFMQLRERERQQHPKGRRRLVEDAAAPNPARARIIANGDTFQLTNHELWTGVRDKQAYCDKFLWRIFPNRVFLKQNWRLKDEEQRKLLVRLLEDLKAGKEQGETHGGFILRLLEKHGLTGQTFTDPEFVRSKGKVMPCLAWSNPYGNAINVKFGGPEEEGMEVVCKSYMMRRKKQEDGTSKKVGLRMNKVYVVEGISGNNYLIRENPDDEQPKPYPRIKFRRNIAQTTHAVQGETLSEFAVFEALDNPDWRWFYTAISRADDLTKAWIYT